MLMRHGHLMPVPETGHLAAAGCDFITIDDGGAVSYAASARALDFEYPEEAECIVDRDGNNYPLYTDEFGRTLLGRSLERADLPWLRRAWATAQRDDPVRYPVVRKSPDNDADFLSELFEILCETSTPEAPVPGMAGRHWTIVLDGREWPLDSLDGVSSFLFQLGHPAQARVRDPYGHLYQTVARTYGRLRPHHYLLFVEEGADVPARLRRGEKFG